MVHDSIAELKRLLPKAEIPLASELLFRRGSLGQSLEVYFNGKYQGAVHNAWLAKTFIKAYLTNDPPTSKNCISPILKHNVYEYLREISVQ